VILRNDLVEIALAITAGSFVLAVLFLIWGTWLTSRRDRMALQRTREDRA
jgi:hypothetical protein